jgi:cephalosporin-C deacetylase-like acetyl esterase
VVKAGQQGTRGAAPIALVAAAKHRGPAETTPDGPLEVHDVEFSGARGDRIRGWYLRPPGSISGSGPVPVVVKFIGYGGGRGTPTEHTTLPAAALDTLRYGDCALLARRITAECLLSTGLMDGICPPSTVFAAYNEIRPAKDIAVHPFSGHTVPPAHTENQLRHLRRALPAD